MSGYCVIFDEIIFIEGKEPDSKALERIECDLSFKIGAQLKNLNDVKRVLAAKAHKLGANAILDFKYGQKSRLLAIDDIAYFGSGIAAILSAAKYAEMKDKTGNG